MASVSGAASAVLEAALEVSEAADLEAASVVSEAAVSAVVGLAVASVDAVLAVASAAVSVGEALAVEVLDGTEAPQLKSANTSQCYNEFRFDRDRYKSKRPPALHVGVLLCVDFWCRNR